MSGSNIKALFQNLLSLQGQAVRLGLRRGSVELRGTLENVMFDSILVRATEGPRVVAFNDILYLDPISSE